MRESQRREGQPALPAGWQITPGALAQSLHEPLAPARALAHELPERRRGLLFGHIAGVVDDADPLPGRRQAQPDLGILGQVALVPSADALDKAALAEYLVSPQRNYSAPRIII